MRFLMEYLAWGFPKSFEKSKDNTTTLTAEHSKTFAKAMIYAPENVVDQDSVGPCYMHGCPDELPQYLKEFGEGLVIPISASVCCLECCGVPGQGRLMLSLISL
jgi:hypothetical protein